MTSESLLVHLKKYKIIIAIGIIALINALKKEKVLKSTLELEIKTDDNAVMELNKKDREDWLTNIVGDLKSGIFTYGIQKNLSDGVNEYTFYVMTSNLDNHFDIIVKEGSTFDHKKIIAILKKIDRNISEYEFITVSSNNDQKEKEKLLV